MSATPRPSDRRVQTVCLLTLTLIATGFAMAELQPVLVPFVLALFLSQCLAPLILLLMGRGRLPRWLAVTVAVVLAAAVLTGVGFVVASSVQGHNGAGNQFAVYRSRLDELYRRAASSRVARFVGVQPDGEGGGATFLSYVVPYIPNGLGQVAGLSSHTATVVLLMAFLLYGRRWDPADGPRGFPVGAPAADGGTDGPRRGGLVAEIEARVQQYISVTVAISALTGVLVGGSLGVLDVQFAAVWGLLAGVLTFIPNFGGVIATLLPLPVVLLDPKLSIPVQVLAFAIPAGIQVVIGSLLQPKMTGQSLDLHPVVILLSLLFFTLIWGPGGAFLAVPLTATFKIVFEKIPNFRPLAAALAGNLDPLTASLEAPAVEAVTVARVTTEARRHGDGAGEELVAGTLG